VRTIKVELRENKGSKVRSNEIIPGVIYGGGLESTSIQANANQITNAYRKLGTSKTFDITIGRKKHIVYIGAVQVSLLNQHQLTHFDLIKVSADDTMSSKVKLSVVNREVIEKKGLIINVVSETLNLEYAVGSGVSHIDFDVSELVEHDVVHISDIVLPEGVSIMNEMDEVVLTISAYTEVIEETDEEVITEVESIKQKDEE